jgi:hypothetical protein
MLNVIEYNGGTLRENKGVINECLRKKSIDPKTTFDNEREDARLDAKARAEAITFLLGADPEWYGKLVEDLENAFTQGANKYPKNLTDSYKLLVNWTQEHRTVVKIVWGAATVPSNKAEGAFTNVGSEQNRSGTTLVTMGIDGQEFLNIWCYNCRKHGHYTDRNDFIPRCTTL